MPTATSFTALGAGNGFPSCIDKVDMTQPTSSSTWSPPITNPLTLNQVMNLYWNLYGMVGAATATGTAGTSTQSNLNIPDAYTPKDRVCGDTDGDYSDYREDTAGAPDFPTTIQIVGVSSGIIAMYDGVTTNEDNFIGYAMGNSELPYSIAVCKANGTSSYLEVQLFAGYVPAVTDNDAWLQLSDIYLGDSPTITNVTYQGIPFIQAELTIGSQSNISATITDVTLYTY